MHFGFMHFIVINLNWILEIYSQYSEDNLQNDDNLQNEGVKTT